MRRLLPILFVATATLAQDVYVPPVAIGIAHDGKVRKPKTPIAFPDERATWRRVRSARYDVLSNASVEQTRGIVEEVETLASILTKASPRFRFAAVPTTVLVFADRGENEPYFELLLGVEKPAATGLYVRHASGGTMLIDASRRNQRIAKTAMHELVHDLLRQSEQFAPQWLEEGLAEYFSAGDIRDGKMTAGSSIRSHTRFVRRGLPMPLEQMFAVRAETEEAMLPQFYAQSWAAVNWLMRTNRDRFFPFLEDVERGAPVAGALERHYGKSLRDMEHGIRTAHVGDRIELSGVKFAVPDSSPVDRATLLFELGRFLSYVSGAEDDANRHYQEALRIDPRHARTLAAVGRFEEAIAAGLRDPEVHLMYAETLLTTALGPFAGIFEPLEGDTESFRKARALAGRALALGAGEGIARAAIGTSYFVETDPAPGIVHLERARALLPARSDIALNLYAMLLRTEQLERAESLYGEVFANARDKQLTFAAKNVRLVAETARANTLAKAGKFDEAAAIVRGLAATIDEPAARRELEEQAASLESVGAVNRHITMYNDAVALANSGKNQSAMKLLDELLLVAKDAQVVRDAKKFREELRRR